MAELLDLDANGVLCRLRSSSSSVLLLTTATVEVPDPLRGRPHRARCACCVREAYGHRISGPLGTCMSAVGGPLSTRPVWQMTEPRGKQLPMPHRSHLHGTWNAWETLTDAQPPPLPLCAAQVAWVVCCVGWLGRWEGVGEQLGVHGMGQVAQWCCWARCCCWARASIRS